MQDISVIILTFNEERHIRRALENARKFAKEVFVVDSYSTDRTVEIAQEMGAKVYQHEWENHSRQFAWALANLPVTTEWIWRLDADEYLTNELIAEIEDILPQNDGTTNGYTAMRIYKFMGRPVTHGIISPIMLRLFRRGHAKIEDQMMDEHIYVTDGKVGALRNAFYDENFMSLTEWTQKHNGYATREAMDLLMTEYGLKAEETAGNIGPHSMAVRRKKMKYTRLPLFWRSMALFVYRYIFRLGFLDGKEGFLWHFLQGFWYRTLADAKVYEIKKRMNFDDGKIKAWLEETSHKHTN